MEPMIVATARQLAEENGLDWRRIQGSGTGGQISEGDVLDYLMRVMSGEEELPEGSVDPIPATLEQDMAAMRSMIAGSGMAEEGEIDSLMAGSKPTVAPEPMFSPEPIAAHGTNDVDATQDRLLEDDEQPLERAEPVHSEEERAAAISAPSANTHADAQEGDSLEADDFDFDMEDPLAASAAVPLTNYEANYQAEVEPMAALSSDPETVQASLPPSELPAFEPMALSDVTPLSDEDLAALMGDPIPSTPTDALEPAHEPMMAAQALEGDELEGIHAPRADFVPDDHEPELEPMAAASGAESETDATNLEPLMAAPAVEHKPALEDDFAALAGTPVLNEPEPVQAIPVPLEPVLAAPIPAPAYVPTPVPAYVPMASAGASSRLSEVNLRVQFDVSALQEAALQLEPLIGQVGMAFFLARAVSRHAHLLGQSAVSHSRISDGSFAPLHGIGSEFKSALEDYGTAPAGEALGIAVAYAGELGLEEASSAQAAYTVSLGKPYGETTGLTLRGEVSVVAGAAFLNAVADSLHKPITLLV